MKTKITLLLLFVFTSLFSKVSACDQSTSTLSSIVQNGNGTYTLTFQVCFAGSAASQGDSHGFYIEVTGATIQSVSPTSITNSVTVSSSISGNTATWGPWNNNSSSCFVCLDDARVCYNVSVTTDVRPTGWAVGGQEYAPPPPGPSASWCEYTGTVPLSIQIMSFYAEKRPNLNLLHWVAEELNNKQFIVERSTDMITWEQIATINGRENSNEATLYMFEDATFSESVNYYRIKDVDFLGSETPSFAIAVHNPRGKNKLEATYNFMGQKVDDSYRGNVVEVYSDGTRIKKYRE
jgi:hypothetical protein